MKRPSTCSTLEFASAAARAATFPARRQQGTRRHHKAHKPGVGLITREQVEKMRGKWIDARYSSKDVPQCQCSICGKKYIGLETDFCQYCGAPMTDKAVDILWKRLEAMQDEAETV